MTANLLVRREAFDRIGGFQELTRSGGDLDFSWRLQAAGFELGLNQTAAVGHQHRDSLKELLKQARRVGSGSRWLGRRHPGYDASFRLAFFAPGGSGGARMALLGQPRRGAFKAIDGLWGLACDAGMLESNIPVGQPEPTASRVLFADEFPLAGDPLAAAAARGDVRVEAARRPARGGWGEVRGRVAVAFAEDEAPLDTDPRCSRSAARAAAAPAAVARRRRRPAARVAAGRRGAGRAGSRRARRRRRARGRPAGRADRGPARGPGGGGPVVAG